MNIPNKFFIQDFFAENPNFLYVGDYWAHQSLYYYNPQVTFREVPDEISLTIPGLCYQHCSQECNSKFCWVENWKEEKKELTWPILNNLIYKNPGITCVTFMTSLNFRAINELCILVQEVYPELKIALYIGQDLGFLIHCQAFRDLNFDFLDYIKVGKFDKNFGPLDNPNTNQKFFKINHNVEGKNEFEDITYKFLQKPI